MTVAAIVTPRDPAGVIAINVDCEPPYADLALERIQRALESGLAIILMAPDQRLLDMAKATVMMLLPSEGVRQYPADYCGPVCGMESTPPVTH